jgi:hypothetical protein
MNKMLCTNGWGYGFGIINKVNILNVVQELTKSKQVLKCPNPPGPPARRGPAATADSDPSGRPGCRAAGTERCRDLPPPRSAVQDQPPSPERWGQSPLSEDVVDCVARIISMAAMLRLDVPILGRSWQAVAYNPIFQTFSDEFLAPAFPGKPNRDFEAEIIVMDCLDKNALRTTLPYIICETLLSKLFPVSRGIFWCFGLHRK